MIHILCSKILHLNNRFLAYYRDLDKIYIQLNILAKLDNKSSWKDLFLKINVRITLYGLNSSKSIIK